MPQSRTFTEVQPPGMVSFFGNSTAPTGWISCTGAAISRSTYSDLFSAIGTTYGSGDGSSTFNIPDMRGEFIRGWDGGRGVDSNFGASPRSFANVQKANAIAYNLPDGEGFGGYITAGNDDNPESSRVVMGVDAVNMGDYTGTIAGHVPGGPVNNGNWIVDPGWGGGACRPRNIAFLICIKY
jgi:phage-related tail fiber protein